MSLLSPAEALAFNGFLSSVDYGDVLDSEWSTLSAQLAPPKGKEALAKATKDLMSLEPQLDESPPDTSTRPSPPPLGHASDSPPPSPPASASLPAESTSTNAHKKMQTITATAAASASAMNGWPTFASSTDPNNHHHGQQHRYTYGFGVPSHLRVDLSSSPSPRSNGNGTIYANPFEPPLHVHPPQLPLPYPHAHSDSSLRHRQSSIHSQSSPTSSTHGHGHGFMLPPLPDHAQQQMHVHSPTSYSPIDTLLQPSRPQHPGISSTTSAPSVLLQRKASSKRTHPADNNDSDTSSSTTHAHAHAKRQRRPSTTPSADSSTPSDRDRGQPPTTGAQRQTLLSPSQKRANHIQSEQKRRANIRRGYEALCEVVPTLREAIRAEEDALAAMDEEKAGSRSRGGGGSRKKGKGKAKAGEDMGGSAGIDGRAGPRSENVVLSQTIDHLQSLLTERETLLQRLSVARNTLVSRNPTHPALHVAQEHMAGGGVALWEREWGGGTGWGMDEEGEE
ncbi:hypothetical protein EIP91_003038 [Steccherinum ochraceum]|uniref:BHLH domain-containing protein n=1 Tax=Steccherinum ochraceum TaxID=92696 RepID=A0A4R0RHC1_9APHY|nr:hypothetical protein EIP91_003038 [Steccherinum ochraceum]